MLHIVFIISIFSVVVSQGFAGRECPPIEKEFSMNGFQKDDILICFLHVEECVNGSLSFGERMCNIGHASITKPSSTTNNLIGILRLVFGLIEDIKQEESIFGQTDVFVAQVYMNMDEVKVGTVLSGGFDPDQLKHYLDEVVAMLPEVINKDPEFQMQFYDSENNLVRFEDIIR